MLRPVSYQFIVRTGDSSQNQQGAQEHPFIFSPSQTKAVDADQLCKLGCRVFSMQKRKVNYLYL